VLKKIDLRDANEDFEAILPSIPDIDEGPVETVKKILEDVRHNGDEAIRRYTELYDKITMKSFVVTQDQLYDALDRIPKDLREALEQARESIVNFHQHSMCIPKRYENNGISVEHLVRPISRAGLYAPGGRARYPSSVLMCGLPARVAGVESLVLCCPPGSDGRINDMTLAAAAIAGIDEVYAIGGAQAIAAMAYGTETIKKVQVIVGPGNRYVSVAKRLVTGQVGVPNAYAGPSEVVVVADSTVPPEWAAIDVVVQAEHGPDGLAWLVGWDESVIDTINSAIEGFVESSPRKSEIISTLSTGGYAVLVNDYQDAIKVANIVAPEHLELLCEQAEEMVPMVFNAGAVFCGGLSPASVGDYIAGPSHVLPTYRSAKFSSVLGVSDFIRTSHAITINQEALDRVAPYVISIASAEGLEAHARSVVIRRSKYEPIETKATNKLKGLIKRGE
jgi:histidinol dehydrogenase